MKTLFSIEVKGKHKSWGFMFKGSPEHLNDWLNDGLEVYEVVNTVPVYVQQLGLTSIWCKLQDTWKWLRLW